MEMIFIGRLVRIMACNAPAILVMPGSIGNKPVVALPAELSNVTNGFEFVPAFRDVAECAVSRSNRPMDEFTLSHGAVAVASHA